MNQKRHVWLPPDGDVRLVRFQQELAAGLGLTNGVSLPPYLELRSPAGRPSGEVRLGGWALVDGEPVLEASDDIGTVGPLRFSLGAVTVGLADLHRPPDWRWTRGLTATLEIVPTGDPAFILWTWANRRGWKSFRPKG